MKLFLAFIAVYAFAAPALAQQPPLSSIRVTGDAQVSAKPDRVQIDIGVTTHAVQSQQAASDNARELDAVLAALKKAAPAAVLKTVSYSLNPNYKYPSGGGEPSIEGYNAQNVVQVTLDDLGKIGTVIDAAASAGANHVQGIQFTLRDQDAVRAEALRAAATKARADADVLAQALGLKVLRVLTAEEGGGRVSPLRFEPAAARGAMAASLAAPTPVQGGTIEVSASVTLTVEVSPVAR